MSLDLIAGLGVGVGIGAGIGYAIGTSQSLPPDLATIISRIRVQVQPTDGTPPYYVDLLKDSQSIILEVAVKDNHPWFKSMCIIGFEDRGLPYDGLGHGEGTFRIWWGKSPNFENYPGDMWFVEMWLGGGYPKSCDIFEPLKGTWTNVLNYAVGGQWATYKEIGPDGHIMG